MLGCYKIRAVPINVNYRYVADELRHLFADADLVGVLVQPEFADRLAEIAADLPELQWSLELGEPYEAALAASSAARDFAPRRSDDHYVIYTGGTTGPAQGRGVDPRERLLRLHRRRRPDPPERAGSTEPARAGRPHHGRAGRLPARRPADARGRPVDVAVVAVLRRARSCCCRARSIRCGCGAPSAAEGVNLMTVVGDPVVRPLVDAWLERGTVRRVDPVLDRLGRRAAVAGAARAAHGHPARRDRVRRLRLVRDRSAGRPAPRAEADHSGENTAFTPYPVDHGDRRGHPPPGRAGLGRRGSGGR